MVTFLSKCRRHLAWGGHTRAPGPGPLSGPRGRPEEPLEEPSWSPPPRSAVRPHPLRAGLRPACEPDAAESASLGTAGLRKTPRVPPLQSSPVAVANIFFQ